MPQAFPVPLLLHKRVEVLEQRRVVGLEALARRVVERGERMSQPMSRGVRSNAPGKVERGRRVANA